MAPAFREPAGEPWSISHLTRSIQLLLQDRFDAVKVVGEVTDLARPASGHVYFTLKDDEARLRAVMWRSTAARLGVDLDDGLEIVAWGHLDVYPPRGTYQLIVDGIATGGLGALERKFRRLREKLAAEGLFDARWKKPLPRFPKRVVVITSPTAAAVRDFCEVTRRRWRLARVILIGVRVQGEGAADEIVTALEQAHRMHPRPDVIVLTRGGGSIEDLWAFNEERLVRAIFAAEIPVVAAIGHEIDVTLADLVADVRALTPSEAAERVFPSRAEIARELDQLARRLAEALRRSAHRARLRLEALAARPVLRRPREVVERRRQQVDDWSDRLVRAARHALAEHTSRLALLARRLEDLNPRAVLARGYSITRRLPDGPVVTQADQASAGSRIETILARGRLESEVTLSEQAPEGP